MEKMCILMHPLDNVATVLQDTHINDHLCIVDGEKNLVGEITAAEEIPFAHKICLRPVPQRSFVMKFGVVIGRASAEIPTGGYAHIHNIVSIQGSENVVRGGSV